MSNHRDVELKIIEKTDLLFESVPESFKPELNDFMKTIRFSTSARTRYEYLLNIRQFIYYLSDAFPNIIKTSDLSVLMAKDFEDYMIYLSCYETDGTIHTNSPISLKRKLSALRMYFKYLYNENIIDTLNIIKVKMPKVPKNKSITYMSSDESYQFIKDVYTGDGLSKRAKSFHKSQKTRDLAIVLLLLSSGIRISECIELDLSDIDMKNNSISIIRKGGNREIVYFSDEAKEYILDYLDERRKNRNVPDDENALFLSNRNTRISVRAVQNLVKKYASSSVPLKNITPHKLRSTFGTNLYQSTGDIYAVAEALGHSDVNTTKEHYAHISDDIKKDNRNKVKYTN